MGTGVIVGRDLLLLAIKAPADLVAATVVPNLLEALASLYVGELLAFLVLGEVHDETSDVLSTFHLAGHILLEVFVDVLFDTLLV